MTNDNRKIILWYNKTIEELEFVMRDHNLSNEDKKHINGTIAVLKRLKKKFL